MLNCKQFVQQSTRIIENEDLTIGQRIQHNLHRFLCFHCRKYFNQAEITAKVAKGITPNPIPKQLLEISITEMKGHSKSNQEPK